MNRCGFTWQASRGEVRCIHPAGHGYRHEAENPPGWPGPWRVTFVAVGEEGAVRGRWAESNEREGSFRDE